MRYKRPHEVIKQTVTHPDTVKCSSLPAGTITVRKRVVFCIYQRATVDKTPARLYRPATREATPTSWTPSNPGHWLTAGTSCSRYLTETSTDFWCSWTLFCPHRRSQEHHKWLKHSPLTATHAHHKLFFMDSF